MQCRKLEQDDAKREDIAPRIQAFRFATMLRTERFQLLGRHVCQRTTEMPSRVCSRKLAGKAHIEVSKLG